MRMNRPTIRELECFVAVGEELNFSRAAKRLALSQPPLSRQVQSLELKLGAALLSRNTRSVSLTRIGERYLEDARTLLNRLDAASDAVRRYEEGETTRLRLAFVGVLLDERLIQVFQEFHRRHPHCQIELADSSPAAQLEALTAGLIDGGFVGALPETVDAQFRSFVWKVEPLMLALPASHPLAARAKVALSAVREEGWIMVSRTAAAAFRLQFETLCRSHSFFPRIVQESERVPAVLTMVAAGQGISLLPQSVSRLVGEGVVFIPLSGRQPRLEHGFAYRDTSGSPELLDLVRLLRSSGSLGEARSGKILRHRGAGKESGVEPGKSRR